MKSQYKKNFLLPFLLFFISVIKLFQIIIVVISRFLYTSSRNAILLDDPRGTAPGWLFGRGDCGYARGKTLAETMVPTLTKYQKFPLGLTIFLGPISSAFRSRTGPEREESQTDEFAEDDPQTTQTQYE